MTDTSARIENLLLRVARKRSEVEKCLDDRFYTRCREILLHIKAIDARGVFNVDPSRLPDYQSSVQKPRYWKLIEANLQKYEYASASEFMEDMRRVVDNCYAYNGEQSTFSSLARELEAAMEDAFVKELGEVPPSAAEMQSLARRIPKQASVEIVRIYNLYEKKDAGASGTKAFISLSSCRCATKRRILELMRAESQKKESHSAPRRPPTGPLPVKRAPTAGGMSAAPQLPHQSTITPAILQTAGELDFHEEKPTETVLERVPQNLRTTGMELRDISPVQPDSSASGGED